MEAACEITLMCKINNVYYAGLQISFNVPNNKILQCLNQRTCIMSVFRNK